MSAFMVGKAHIDALVTAALATSQEGPLRWFTRPLTEEEAVLAHQVGAPWGLEGPEIARMLSRSATRDEADRIGQLLMRENRLSLNHRYNESEVEDIYAYTRSARPRAIDPVVILKAIDCYEYQSCEHPGWEASEARGFCQALRRRMIRRLPGYDQAPWEIGSREQYVKPGPEGRGESC
jgi:hypothetical protein